MPADSPMVLVTRELLDKAAHALGATVLGPQLHKALSASPVREGLGASASPIPTEQAGGPVVGDETWESIAAWQRETFGPVELARQAQRAAEEMDELLADPTDVEEAADVCIVLAGYPGIREAIDRKMAKNRSRKWRLNGDGTGYHVKPSAPSTTSAAEQVGTSEASADDVISELEQRAFHAANQPQTVEVYQQLVRDLWQTCCDGSEVVAPSPGEGDAPVAWRHPSTLPHPKYAGCFFAAIRVSERGGPPEWQVHLIALDDETHDVHPNYNHGWRWEDYELWTPCVWPAAPDSGTRPTPDTPEGLREKVEAVVTALADDETLAELSPQARMTFAVRFRRSILSALQPQAQGGE